MWIATALLDALSVSTYVKRTGQGSQKVDPNVLTRLVVLTPKKHSRILALGCVMNAVLNEAGSSWPRFFA